MTVRATAARLACRAAPLVAMLFASACSAGSGAPAAAPHTRDATIQNVRLGPRPGELLITACRGGDVETCTLTLADPAKGQAVEYAAPAGASIKDAAFSGDGVIAVVVQPQADARGNHPSAIVAFRSGHAAMTVRHREAVQLRFPAEDGARLLFWRRDCRSPTERYCRHDLQAATPPGAAAQLGAAYRFAEVGRIVPQGGTVVVNAGFPAEAIETDRDYLGYAGSTAAWRPAPGAPFGLARLAGADDVLQAMPLPNGLLLLLQNGEGMGLYRQTPGGMERLSGLPPAVSAMPALYVHDVDVSPDGGQVAMIVGGADRAAPTRLFVLDVAARTWRAIDPAALAPSRRIVLKEMPDAP